MVAWWATKKKLQKQPPRRGYRGAARGDPCASLGTQAPPHDACEAPPGHPQGTLPQMG